MATIYEHNFGFWEIDGQVEQAFFEYVQRQSVQKTCDRCERRVRLMPAKTLCAPCVNALECGAPRQWVDIATPAENRCRPKLL